ncbi:MAG: DUF5652 family protein [Candidatus Uhrbacteria bacterium]
MTIGEFIIGHPLVLVVLVLWTLPWKAVALWRSARRGERNWFIALLVFNTLAVLEILYIFVFSRPGPKVEMDDGAETPPRNNE